MKTLFRSFLINLGALVTTTEILPGLNYSGGLKTLAYGSIIFMVINFTIVPLLKVMLLPLNLLTFGLFTWVVNVIALYFLTILVPQFDIIPFTFQGFGISGFVVPSIQFNTLQVAVIASFIIGFISHFLHWLSK